ncbi:MAG: GH116 family glycosyl hydrolase [Treponema sp.]|nr:GH116 family glycosyl hydrolase [Treponema sp.]
MRLQLNSKKDNFFCYTDGDETYLSFHTTNKDLSAGIVRKTQTVISDFCIFYVNESGLPLIETRYEDSETTVCPECFTIKFKKSGTSFTCSLIDNAIYVKFAAAKPNQAKLVLLPLPSLAKRMDRSDCIATAGCVSVGQPDAAILLQLSKIYGKKASFAKILTIDDSCYISFAPSAAQATKKSAKLLASDAYGLHKKKIHMLLSKTQFRTDSSLYTEALRWAKLSGFGFVTGKKSKGIWGGIPWYRDYWSRDTFISLPGILLFAGRFTTAEAILREFADYQDINPRSKTYGRIPNLYNNASEILYNTADGTLLFIRAVYEYACFTGDKKLLEDLWPTVQLAIECDRKLRMDASGFLLHGDADTWMDARIFGEKSWSQRGNRANDIQALWFTALICGTEIAKLLGYAETAELWNLTAENVRSAFSAKFFNGTKMADCVLQDGTADYRCRPNQLMTITLPVLTGRHFVQQETARTIVEYSIPKLLFPYGICSLEQHDPYFHPWHEGIPRYHKDAAYHNGTIWEWNAGFTVEALCMTGHQELAWRFTQNTAERLLETGCAGTLSETLSAYRDQQKKIIPSGTYSQAWSVAEFSRAAWQAFLGLRPDLLHGIITLSPHFPKEWKKGSVSLLLGIRKKTLRLNISWQKTAEEDTVWNFSVLLRGLQQAELQQIILKVSFSGKETDFKLYDTAVCTFSGKIAGAGNETLSFAEPANEKSGWNKPLCLKYTNWLAEIVLSGKFNGGHPASLTEIRY